MLKIIDIIPELLELANKKYDNITNSTAPTTEIGIDSAQPNSTSTMNKLEELIESIKKQQKKVGTGK